MPAQFPAAPRSMPRRPKVGPAAPAPGTAPNSAFHPPTHPGQHPTGGGGTGGVGNLGPFPSVGTQQPGIGNLGTSPGIHPGQTTVNPISTPFYGTQRGADTQFGVDRMRQAIGRAPVGFAPEVLAKMQADADRRIGFGVDSQLQTAGRFGGAQGALLSQLATAGGATDRAGVGADITKMQQDRLRDDTRYADAMGQSLAQFGQAERGLESNEAGRRTSLEAGQAEFNASMDYNNQNANANRDLQGQGMNLDANQFDRQFQRSGEQQQFNNILQLLNSGQINDGQYRQMIQQLLRQQGMGNLPGFTGGMGGSATRAYARGTGDGTHPGGPALVGEEGPEIAILPPGTSVIPHKPSMAMMGMPAYKCGTPHYAGGTPNAQGPGMFRNLLSRQVNPVGIQSSSPANAAVWAAMADMNPGLGITPTGGDPLAAREWNASHMLMSRGGPRQGAGSSGIYRDMYQDAVTEFEQDQAIDAQNQQARFAGYDPKKLPKFGGAYANGTPDWQNMVGPPPDLQMPPVEQVPNSPLVPIRPVGPSLWPGASPDAQFFAGDPGSVGTDTAGGSMTIGGRTLSFSDPEGARLAESRGALRNKITGGGLTDTDLPALMGEYARTSIGDNQPDDLIAGGLRGLAMQQQFEDAEAKNQYYRQGGRYGHGGRAKATSLETLRRAKLSGDPALIALAEADIQSQADEAGVTLPDANATTGAKKPMEPNALTRFGDDMMRMAGSPIQTAKDAFGGLIDAGKSIVSGIGSQFGGSSAQAGSPKPPNARASSDPFRDSLVDAFQNQGPDAPSREEVNFYQQNSSNPGFARAFKRAVDGGTPPMVALRNAMQAAQGGF